MRTQIVSHRASKVLIFALRLLTIAALVLPVLVWPATPAATAVEMEPDLETGFFGKNPVSPAAPLSPAGEPPPVPLPHHCDGVTPPGETPPACCIYGYVYYEGEPVDGASVHIESPYGALDPTTAGGLLSSEPYYSADLSSAPLLVSPGDVITITASYSDMVSARTWTVQSDGQHVDLGLVVGYQAPGPISADHVQVKAALQSAPLMFVENTGQFDERARFQVRSADGTIWLTEDALWITVLEPEREGSEEPRGNALSHLHPSAPQPRSGVNLKLGFVGANPHPHMEPFDRLDTRVSFFIGSDPDQWRADVPVWGGVRYVDLYPGIDLEITSQNGRLVQRLVVRDRRASSRLAKVRLRVEGADVLTLDGNSVRLATALGDFALPLIAVEGATPRGRPVTYSVEPKTFEMFSPFAHLPASISARTASVSDLLYSTFLGGSGYDKGEGIAVDGSGNAYVTGDTSGSPDFPTTPGAFDTSPDSSDVFVVKLNPAGSELVYATFLGGSSGDGGKAIAVDGSGNAYVTGVTWSSDFPTEWAYYPDYNGNGDAFLTKLNPAGSGLLYSTFLGGSNADHGFGIALDGDENGYVTGSTCSSDFPTTSGAFQPSHNGGFNDAFVVTFDNIGLVRYSTFLGGSDGEAGLGIAVDEFGNAHITGWTDSPDFITETTPCPGYDKTYNGGGDAFVVMLSYDGSHLVNLCTLLGGSDIDRGVGITIGGTTIAYVTGETWSSDFPWTSGAFDTSLDGGSDAFIAKLSGHILDYSTFLGGSSGDGGTAIAVDGDGNAYATGGTSSSDFPTTSGAFDTTYNGGGDAFVAKLNGAGSTLLYSTFLGGSDWDIDYGVAVGGGGSAYVTGLTRSSDFPTTPSAFDTTFNGDYDAFVAKIAVEYTVPNAAFTAFPLSGTVPLTVTFTDQSTGDITSWSWDFGDGGTSTDQNPTHTYTISGTYTVSLTVSGPEGSDTETKVAYITAGYPAPTAAFTASPLYGTVPLTVTFTDQSIGDIIAWDWTFGNGSTSGARHPSHIYENAGTYTVSLTVSGPGGSDTETKVGCITVSPPGSSPPTATIDSITPNPATQGQDMIIFNGSGEDNDEGGAYIVAYNWRSDLDGWLSDREDFTVQASELSVGTHTIRFKVQDDESEWSQEVTRTLTVQAGQADVRTLMLVNRQKLEALYSGSEATQVMDKLNALAAHDSVKGLVVQVENDGAVAAAYAAWDADPTSTVKANAVAEMIKALIDSHWTTHPDLEYLVIAGDDRAIPFRRVLDQTRHPESNYGSVSCTSVTGAALCDDMSLTDDYYADAVPTVPGSPGWDGHDLYIPDLGAGRLIETPGEIIAQIDTFLAGDGVTASGAIVTGYDFIKDGAQAMCSELSGDGLTTDCTLIGESWGSADFIANVLNTRHDVVSINGHAHHYVIGTPSGGVYSSDVAAATADHTRAILYTVGCHSGLNVPPTNPYQPLDLAQALIGHQANYIANTGYGWGYVTSIGLSEQLMLDFTERLVYGQSASVGQALAAAKQEYYLNEADFEYYDEKIMIESTLYGLPMYRYATPTTIATRSGAQGQSQGATAIKEEHVTNLGDGLTVNSLSYQFPALLAESTGDGLYYTFGGLAHAGHGEPIQPKYTADLSFPETEAHGVVFKGGVYTDVTSFDPVVERAVTETTTLAEPTFDAPGWYPSLLHSLNRLERGDRLVTLLAQFNSQSQTERVYDRLSFDVYYHTTSSDWTPPSITSMSSRLWAGNALVTVGAEDESGIEAVVIAYTGGDGIWDSVSLTESEGMWTGSFPASADTEFFVQAVDEAGNVAASDNDGQYFKPGESLFAAYLPFVLRNH